MRVRSRHLVAMFFATSVLFTASCADEVKYPNCATDEDCKQNATGQAVSEYCVNKQCQECRDNTHCDEGYECKSGRCEEKSECPCDPPLQCENKKCVEPECVSDEDCDGGKVCKDYTCVVPPCTTDQECGAGMVCDEGVCTEARDNISAACQPMDRSNGEVIALSAVNFEFNKADLTVETRETLERNAECLRQAPELTIVLEGHADDRGTQEYNLALGERRAQAVQDYLRNLGLELGRMTVVSKGENEPVCNSESEDCYSQNRRVEFVQRR